MRQTVTRILEGKFDYEKGSLDFSCSRIELTLQPGEVYTGSFGILAPSGHLTEGYLYSRDIRMTLLSDYFSGTGEEIGYTFYAKGLEEGDVVKGEIQIISNQGEYFLPYVVQIAHSVIQTSLGSVRNLFHFANLAKTSWDEAVKLFYSDSFKSLFKGNDKQYLRAYAGLSEYYGNEQNVEEFLLEINKKNPIEYIIDRNTITIEEPLESVQEYIDITRNGWGYTSLNVMTESPFIYLSAETLGDSDFLGNFLHYSFIVDPEKMHDGCNFGVIRFFNSYTSFEVTVKVTRNLVMRPAISKDIEAGRCMIDMVTYYKAFRLKKISTDTWLAETGRVVERLSTLKNNDVVSRMFRAQILITEARYNEAKWLLDQVVEEFDAVEEYTSPRWAYYLYLTTLVNREEEYIDRITDEVWNIYNQDTSQWRVAWLLLYLSAEYAVSPAKKWLFIENQLSIQCTSPVMYVEAANMLIINPALLSKLEDVETRILRFIVREGILTRELARHVVYLAGTGKWYSEGIIEILKQCYDLLGDETTVATICNMFISQNKIGPEYFQWYKLGIEMEARVTRIYEYYMMSMDLSAPIKLPKMVYLYFSYQSELDWEHTAFLYAKVIENRKEDEDTFLSYKEQIERFTIKQVSDGHMNRDLAVIYRFVLNESVISKEMADRLVNLIFTHRICIDSDVVTKVIVYQNHECVGHSYPIVNREAFVPLFNKNYTILFEDGFSNRYMKSINYDIEKLMVPGKLANVMLPYVEDNLSFDVYACECSSEMVEIDEENRVRYQRILDSSEIEPAYKTEIRSKLMQYYFDNDRIRELDALLEALDCSEMDTKERCTAIRYMVIRGMFDRAVEWISEFGTEGLEPKDLVKLCSKLITRGDFEPTQQITNICAACFFKGKYDENILIYLCDNFNAMSKDMKKLFSAAVSFDINIHGLCERLLIQMLYTGYYVSERMNIYKKYQEGGANGSVQTAFLTQCCFDFFVKEQLMESLVFDEIARLSRQGEDLLPVCKLAFIKYYSENSGITEADRIEVLVPFIEACVAKGIYFSYFKEFMEQGMEEVNRFADKTFVEYKTDPGKKVMIHYIVEKGDDSKGEYITQEMRDMYGGLHSKSFILFFGENLLYYITEEENDDEQLTESGNITKSDIGKNISTSRFDEINDIVIAHTLGDYGTAEQLIYEYSRKEYVIDKLFTME